MPIPLILVYVFVNVILIMLFTMLLFAGLAFSPWCYCVTFIVNSLDVGKDPVRLEWSSGREACILNNPTCNGLKA